MCDTAGVLTLDDLFDGTVLLDALNQQTDCSGCTTPCQKKQTVEIVKASKVKVKSRCCKRYERKKKAPCKGCPERTKAVA